MPKFVKIPLLAIGTLAGLFVVTFTVYFLNLDMKLLSKIEPFFLKHYDKMPRENYV